MNERPKSFSPMRSGKLLLLFCSAIYLIICVVMAVSQRSFIYHPRVFTREEVERRAQGTKLERWTNSTGEFIGFKHLSVRQPADGIVLIAYGNGSTAIGSNRYVNDIQSAANLDVYILEYPGYEDRPGEPSEASLFTAAAEAFQLLSTNKPAYLVGESLGSGVASYLAGTYPDKVAGIFLISPFNNLAAVAQNHFPFLPVWPLVIDRFPSEKYLQNYHGRVGVSVDGRDIVVPEKFGLKLYNNYNGPKKLWEFPDGEHCQILKPPAEFWHEVIEFWQND